MSKAVLDRVSQLESLAGQTQARLTDLRDEARSLHEEIRGLDARLRTIEPGQVAMAATLELLSDRIVAKLASQWQMPIVIGTTVTLLAVLYAAAQSLRVHGWWP